MTGTFLGICDLERRSVGVSPKSQIPRSVPGSRYPFPATPDGWFAGARSEELARGAETQLRYFGHELALVRDARGAIAITLASGGACAALTSCEANGFAYACKT